MFSGLNNQGQKVLDKDGQLGEVWVGGFDFAHNINKLKKNNIFAVCSGVNLHHEYPSQFSVIKFDLNDSYDQNARPTFKPSFQFIESARQKTNVLVHCAAGISRCSTLLIAYMMHKYKWSYKKSLQKCQKARSCCQPNMGFVKQLLELEKILEIKENS